MKAVVLAAGKGTRNYPLTLTMSKGMLPIANKPLLAWTCDFLDFCDEIILVVNKSQHDIIDYFSASKKIRFVYQDRPLGTGHALLQAEGYLDGAFLVVNGDDIYGKGDMKGFAKQPAPALTYFITDRPENFGIITIEGGAVASIEEKSLQPASNFASCGLYLFDKRIFAALKKINLSPRGEYELTDAIRALIDEGMKVMAHNIKEWMPLPYSWNILDANNHLLDACGSMIHPDAIIRPGAVIEDPVAIDAGSVIGPNCFIRKHSSIGKNCKVGQAVEIKNSIVMDNSFVSHLSYVGDTIVGRNCNIAAGTIFANLRLDEKNVKVEVNETRVDSGRRKLGAIIGDGVKFGTRVTVMPGKRIWPNLLIPACMTIEDDIKSELPLSKYSQKKGNGE